MTNTNNTPAELAKALAAIKLGASMDLTLTSVELGGLCRMTNRKIASVVHELSQGGLIKFDPATGGFVPVEVA